MNPLTFIKKHPYSTIWIITLILYFIDYYKTGNPNPGGYVIIGLFITAATKPFIRYARKKANRKKQINQVDNNITVEFNEALDLEEIKEILGEEQTNEATIGKFEYSGKYQKKLLLTKNEWHEYRKLKEIAAQKGYQVCPKVRLLDLIEPRRGDPKYKTLFYKIQAKHVDFVICDQNLYVKAILELDDNSHNQADRKERDEFVDLILKDVGYTVIRTRSITEEILNIIT